MPASKPSNLIKRHETVAEKSARESAENAMNSGRGLPAEAPARIAKFPIAAKTWREIMREYAAIEGVIVTRLDQGLLIDYCMLTEQLTEIDRMRKASYEVWLLLNAKYEAYIKIGQTEEALKLSKEIGEAFESFNKLDGRADRKRDMLLKLRQVLYLTPRSRAGAAPDPKEKEPPPDELEQLLNEVNEIISGGQGEK